jgi:hypothetical protein
MKRLRENWVWILGLALAVVVLVIVIVFICAFFGNPVSRLLAARTAKGHLADHYPTYTLERVSYNFKDGNYHQRWRVKIIYWSRCGACKL